MNSDSILQYNPCKKDINKAGGGKHRNNQTHKILQHDKNSPILMWLLK